MKQIICILLLICGLSVACATAQAAPLRIVELAVTTKVSGGKPIDSVHRISHRSVRSLYCFSRIAPLRQQGRRVRHVWLHEGRFVKEEVFSLHGPQWQVQSSLPMRRSRVGSWRVEVRDGAAKVIKSVQFQVH